MPIYNAALTKINLQETKRYAGLAKANFNEETIKKACLEAQILSSVQGTWEVYDYHGCAGEVKSLPAAYITGSKINKFLNAAEKLIFLSVTVGQEIEQAVTTYFESGQYAYSLLLDAAATAAVEEAADEMERNIKQVFQSKGYQLLTRFSPGYGDWDIKFQPTMLALANAAKINVKLTESYMLIPRKSITAVIGLVPNQLHTDKENSCENCIKINCLARKGSNL